MRIGNLTFLSIEALAAPVLAFCHLPQDIGVTHAIGAYNLNRTANIHVFEQSSIL